MTFYILKEKLFKRFNRRTELGMFVFFALVGVGNSIYFFPRLDGYPYYFGSNLAGLFLPVFLSVIYCTITGFQYKADKLLLLKTLILYFVQITPFIPLFLQVFGTKMFGDDFERYYTYARYMIEHHTLYGADRLGYPGMGDSYLTQPGYRYFVAAELLLFRELYRFVQFLNLALLITASFFFIKTIKAAVANRKTQLIIFILLILLTPYATKNTLMGLSEWLTMVLLVLMAYFYIIRQQAAAAIILAGFVPFFRQNLLFPVALLVLLMMRNRPKKGWLLLGFLLPLFLPLYHNLYFAGEWRFFVPVHYTPFINPAYPLGYNFEVLFFNLLRLFGFDTMAGNVRPDALALVFLPYFLFLYGYLLIQLPSSGWRWLFVFLALIATLPGLTLGKDYYPRFEFLSAVMTVISYLFLMTQAEGTKVMSRKPDKDDTR